MILILLVSSFFTVFFLTLAASNFLHSAQDRIEARIAERLSACMHTLTPVQIQKRDRLSDLAFLDRLLQHIGGVRSLQHLLSQSGLSLTLGSFVLLSLLLGAIGFFVTAMTTGSLTAALMSEAVCVGLPVFYVRLARNHRRNKFSEHFPDAISTLASSLRAGYSVQMALGSVVSEGGDIVSEQFGLVLSELEIGRNFEEALKGILYRVDTPELRLFISAVVLQRETGGNLAELLDNLEAVIRDRQQLKRELHATTAQARFAGIVLSLLPIFVSFFVFLIHPKYILFFFQEEIGTKLITACVIGQILGILSIRKIVRIEL